MPTNTERLAEIGIIALDEAGGNLAAAATAMGRILAEKPELGRALIQFYLEWLRDQPKPKTQPQSPNPTKSRRREGAHRRPVRERTVSQKAAAMAVAGAHACAAAWDRHTRHGRRLGSLYFREIDAVIAESSHFAGSFLGRGVEDAIDACLLRRIKNHAGSADPDMMLQDAVKDATVTKMFAQAQIEAAEYIAQTASEYAWRLCKGEPELAA